MECLVLLSYLLRYILGGELDFSGPYNCCISLKRYSKERHSSTSAICIFGEIYPKLDLKLDICLYLQRGSMIQRIHAEYRYYFDAFTYPLYPTYTHAIQIVCAFRRVARTVSAQHQLTYLGPPRQNPGSATDIYHYI